VSSADGGSTWSVTTLPPGFDPDGPQALSCLNGATCVVAGFTTDSDGTTDAAAARTTDRGATWVSATFPAGVAARATSCTADGFCAVLYDTGQPLGAGAGATTLTASGLAISTDGGAEFVASAGQDLPAAFLVALSCPAAGTCTVGGGVTTASGVWGPLLAGTTDDGSTFSVEPTPAGADLGQVRALDCTTPRCMALASSLSPGSPIGTQAVLTRSRGTADAA
jgi:hypothetical protein